MKRFLRAFTVRTAVVSALAAAGIAFGSSRPLAQAGGDNTADVAKRLAALEASQSAILRELREIKALIQARSPQPMPPVQPPPAQAPPPENIVLSIDGSASRGRPDARLTIVEFSDFECPFCGRFVRDTYAQIDRDYVATGKVRYVFRHFPIERLHPHAFKAAEAAECARAQGKFWEIHDKLFANQQALTPPQLTAYAQSLGMSVPAFEQCLGGRAASRIRQDLIEGSQAGIAGTPTFFIGATEADGKVHVRRTLKGAAQYAAFKAALDALLAAPDATK